MSKRPQRDTPPEITGAWNEDPDALALRRELAERQMADAPVDREKPETRYISRKDLPRLLDPRPMTPDEVLTEARRMFETPDQRAERERVVDGRNVPPRGRPDERRRGLDSRREEYERERERKLAGLPRLARLKLGLERVLPDERAEIMGRQDRRLRQETQVFPTPKHTWTLRACSCPWRCSGVGIEMQREKVGRYDEVIWRCLQCKRTWRTSNRMDPAQMMEKSSPSRGRRR